MSSGFKKKFILHIHVGVALISYNDGKEHGKLERLQACSYMSFETNMFARYSAVADVDCCYASSI